MADMEIAQALLAASEQNQLAQIIETHNLGELPHSLRLAINIFEINGKRNASHTARCGWRYAYRGTARLNRMAS